jgi:hypothetical protein
VHDREDACPSVVVALDRLVVWEETANFRRTLEHAARHIGALCLHGRYGPDEVGLSFTDDVRRIHVWPWTKNVIHHKTAIFRQINVHDPLHHHDALEFLDGQTVLLHFLKEGQRGTVLQLPATADGAKVPQRAAYV